MKLAWNVKKNTVGSLKNLEREQNRDNANNRNKLIDKSKSDLNYELVPGSRNLTDKTLDLVEKAKVNGSRVQKNSVVDLSNIITLSKEDADKLGYEGTKYYFSSVVEFFQDEFGEENVTSAIVHLDESNPHMHLHVTPVNKDNGKLQAHKVMTRGRVNKIHTELPKFLQERGFDVERGSSREKDGTKKDYVCDINKLKQMTEAEHETLKTLQENAVVIGWENTRLEIDLMKLRKEKEDLEKEVEEKKTEIVDISQNKGHIEQEIASERERLEKEKKARDEALNAKLDYEREMKNLFNQKLALSDELDEMRGLVEDTKALAEVVNTYKDGGYKVPLAKFEWEKRYRPLNVFEKDYNNLLNAEVSQKLVEEGKVTVDETKWHSLSLNFKTRDDLEFTRFTAYKTLENEDDLPLFEHLHSFFNVPPGVRDSMDSNIIKDLERYQKFSKSEFFEEVKDTLKKNEELQEKFNNRVPAKKKQKNDLEL